LPFHPLPEPVCQFVFSSSSRTCLSVCLFILFPTCLSIWFTSLSVNMPNVLSGRRKMLSESINFIFYS
jgi:hypothetical protein